jgi:glutamate--cysteine ligase
MAPNCAIHFKHISPGEPARPGIDFTRLFEQQARPPEMWALGAELELIGYSARDLRRIDAQQVQSILTGFASPGARILTEKGHATEVALEGGSRITIEPGGQIEYSGAPSQRLIDIEKALAGFARRLVEVGSQYDIEFIAAGFDPVRRLEEQNWMPKPRYEIMRPYLGSRGARAWDMMCRTAAIQVNLDYSDLEDLAKKFMVATRLGPVAAAIFANSPFEAGSLSGYKSTRYAAWLETDADRTGPAPLALEGDFSIEEFIKYVESVPMIFIRRNGDYLDFAGRSFTEFLRDTATHGAVLQDFTDHLSTIFTEARLKPYIEQRSADGGQIEMAMAALAFWKGLMYSREALPEALRLAPQLSRSQYAKLQQEVARYGLDGRSGELRIGDLAAEMINLAREGLKRVAPEETRYLDPLEAQVIGERVCPADILIRNFNGSWHGRIGKAVEYLRLQA